jgi:O-acetyl-ADP-ribose deacetylase (regulator of RNase III)
MELIKQISLHSAVVRIVKGDLTQSDADAIVNAANSHLQHGGGVAGAIVARGGHVIQEESNHIGYVPVGRCALTSGGNLKAPYVIHTVGPRWGEGDEEKKLKSAIYSTLSLAAEHGFVRIAMPAVSGGIFGFPKEQCAGIIVGEVIAFLRTKKTSLKEITFYLVDNELIKFFEKELGKPAKDK